MKEGFALEINGVVYGNNNKSSRHFACHYLIGSEPEIHSLPMEGGGGGFSRERFSESPMSGEYFGRLIIVPKFSPV